MLAASGEGRLDQSQPRMGVIGQVVRIAFWILQGERLHPEEETEVGQSLFAGNRLPESRQQRGWFGLVRFLPEREKERLQFPLGLLHDGGDQLFFRSKMVDEHARARAGGAGEGAEGEISEAVFQEIRQAGAEKLVARSDVTSVTYSARNATFSATGQSGHRRRAIFG